MENKPILCIHVGYIPDMNDKNTETAYGSETTLRNMGKLFATKYRVCIFGSNVFYEGIFNDIEYFKSNKFEGFQKENEIDIIILCRYIYQFMEFEMKARKVFIWILDMLPLEYYESREIPNKCKGLLKNVIDRVDGIVTLSNWHKEYVRNFYDLDPNKIFVIGSGIITSMFKGEIKKQKNKFIWTSHGWRGVYMLIDYMKEIRKEIPDAELYVYRDKTAFSEEMLENMSKYDYIHYMGKVDNHKTIEEFESAEMWLYPTWFEESYCLSAVEAQMAKCICITTDIAALKETVGDRGILISEQIYTHEYNQRCINEAIRILKDEELKEKYKEAGHKWAKEQTWEKRAEEWYELFK